MTAQSTNSVTRSQICQLSPCFCAWVKLQTRTCSSELRAQ